MDRLGESHRHSAGSLGTLFPPPWGIGQWIYSFHIPLFFFISGYLAKNSYQLPFKAFAKKYARSLVIPYFTLGLAAYGVWLIKEMVHPVSVVEPIPLWRPLVGMLYGSGADTACLK